MPNAVIDISLQSKEMAGKQLNKKIKIRIKNDALLVAILAVHRFFVL